MIQVLQPFKTTLKILSIFCKINQTFGSLFLGFPVFKLPDTHIPPFLSIICAKKITFKKNVFLSTACRALKKGTRCYGACNKTQTAVYIVSGIFSSSFKMSQLYGCRHFEVVLPIFLSSLTSPFLRNLCSHIYWRCHRVRQHASGLCRLCIAALWFNKHFQMSTHLSY